MRVGRRRDGWVATLAPCIALSTVLVGCGGVRADWPQSFRDHYLGICRSQRVPLLAGASGGLAGRRRAESDDHGKYCRCIVDYTASQTPYRQMRSLYVREGPPAYYDAPDHCK